MQIGSGSLLGNQDRAARRGGAWCHSFYRQRLTSRKAECRSRRPLGPAWRQATVHVSNRSAPLSYLGTRSGRRFDLRQDQRELAMSGGRQLRWPHFMNTAATVRATGAKPITMMNMRYARSSAMARTPYSTALGYRTPDGLSWHVQSVPKCRCTC
jgi:hypothetical protein